MRDFRSGKAQVMVATDVAARGLHISGLPYVVNYDFPSRLEQYIHRAGRTGRLAANGHCFSFFTRNLAPLAQPLLDLLMVRLLSSAASSNCTCRQCLTLLRLLCRSTSRRWTPTWCSWPTPTSRRCKSCRLRQRRRRTLQQSPIC